MSVGRLVFLDANGALAENAPAAPVDRCPRAIVVGNFDGVHRGHQAVLSESVARARADGLMAGALTFDPHPAAVVRAGAPPLLTTLERRAQLMGELGVEQIYVQRFDLDFASWPPERFARDLLVDVLSARVVVVGEDFRFGARRAGDLTLLCSVGAELGFETRVHAVASDARGPFSSTRAREAIAAGDVDEARQVLGRPHALTGTVVRGDGRGQTINVPTANLDGVSELLPKDGVYAVIVESKEDGDEGFRPLAQGVTNVGMRPTVGGTTRTVETFLLGFSGDLYGAKLRVHLVARLRGEQKFASLDDLQTQIARDVAQARARLERET